MLSSNLEAGEEEEQDCPVGALGCSHPGSLPAPRSCRRLGLSQLPSLPLAATIPRAKGEPDSRSRSRSRSIS